MGVMGLGNLLRRRRYGGRGGRPARVEAAPAGAEHLAEFVRTRRGVEGFVEPRTTVSEVTLLLVAHDGEWTRRRVPSVQWAHAFANDLGVPSYDAAVVGVPRRMREFNRRHREAEKARRRAALDGVEPPEVGGVQA